MNPWVRIGRLMRAKGKQGDLEVVATQGLPFLFAEGRNVYLVPPELDLPRQGIVEHVSAIQGNRAVIHLDSVSTWEDAIALEGKYCLIARAQVSEADLLGPAFEYRDFSVIDESAGYLGTFSEFLENPGQRLAVVLRDDDSELLLPWVDEFVKSIDGEAKTISVAVPSGLLEL